jgi:hypothetical protein
MYALDLATCQYNNFLKCKYWSITYLPLILEPNLTYSHTPIFLQIRPWRVDDCDVVLLVTCNLLNPSL